VSGAAGDGTPGTGAAVRVAVRAGNLQTARAGLPFPAQLAVAVCDTAGSPVRGVWVSFRVLSGSAAFLHGARVATAPSDSAGVATAPVLDAGATVGPVRVSAALAACAGVSRPVGYTLRVVPY
jgi:hypothetical protein